MRQFRAAAVASKGHQPAPCPSAALLDSWQPAADLHHCLWAQVKCNEQQQVVNIDLALATLVAEHKAGATSPDSSSGSSGSGRGTSGSSGGSGNKAGGSMVANTGVLLPGLARLPALTHLEIEACDLSSSSIPAEWGQPGAFPALTECDWLRVNSNSTDCLASAAICVCVGCRL